MGEDERILKLAATVIFILFFGAGTVWFLVDTMKTLIKWKNKDDR